MPTAPVMLSPAYSCTVKAGFVWANPQGATSQTRAPKAKRNRRDLKKVVFIIFGIAFCRTTVLDYAPLPGDYKPDFKSCKAIAHPAAYSRTARERWRHQAAPDYSPFALKGEGVKLKVPGEDQNAGS